MDATFIGKKHFLRAVTRECPLRNSNAKLERLKKFRVAVS